MGSAQSTLTGSQDTAPGQTTQDITTASVPSTTTYGIHTPLVNVPEFVMHNINGAFNALQLAGYNGSNCYALLHTLTRGVITSDQPLATGLNVLPVAFEGDTNIRDIFPGIYYHMFQIVLNETKLYETGLYEKTIELLEKKQYWIRNPSRVINTIILGFPGVRGIAVLATITQAKTIRDACVYAEELPRSAGGAGVDCSIETIFEGASDPQKERCCICGLPLNSQVETTDIEHVVSSQLLILLGICPAPKSWAGFWKVFNELSSSGGVGPNWVKHLISFFPEGERERARKVFRSMMLPAHSSCNRGIKSELSPIGVEMGGGKDRQIGDITANINQKFGDMNNTYANKVIIPSINANKGTRIYSSIRNHTARWKDTQSHVFDNIAWLLNRIDQRNNDASWALIEYFYIIANNNTSNQDPFVQLVEYILDTTGLDWNTIHDVLNDEHNKLIIMTKLTLVVEAVLVLFQTDVQTPALELKYESGSDASVRSEDFDSSGYITDHDASRETDPDASIDNSSILSSPGFSQEQVSNQHQGIFSMVKGTSLDRVDGDENSQWSSWSDPGRGKSIKEEQGYSTSSRAIARDANKSAEEETHFNEFIQQVANDAVNYYFKGRAVYPVFWSTAMATARKAARLVFQGKIHSHPDYDTAYLAAINALKANHGGSRKRTTRKRRPSKKPRRTIRRQRRNKKGTQKRRK